MYRKKEIMMDFSNFVPRFQNFEKILPIVFFLLLLLLFLIRNKTFKCVRDIYCKKENVMEMKYVKTSKTNVIRYTLFLFSFQRNYF
jgi:hypothetical protein